MTNAGVLHGGGQMKLDMWLNFFRKHVRKKVFSLHDIVLLSGEEKPSVSVQLSRLVKSKILERPVRGWYVNPFASPSPEELSMVIRHPSYVSLEYALSRHGILSQNVFTITLVTTKLPYTYRTGISILEYHQIKRSLFRGYVREGSVLVAKPEKALLDLIYIRYVRGSEFERSSLDSLMDDMYTEILDYEKLIRYSEGFDRKTVKVIADIFQ